MGQEILNSRIITIQIKEYMVAMSYKINIICSPFVVSGLSHVIAYMMVTKGLYGR
jgi:hypothetical protein